MSRVGAKDTGPEREVRRMAHALGYRFRICRADLPGRPDIVFPSRNKVIFVHGCFWHGHSCGKGKLPKSNTDFWAAKIALNRARDRRSVRALRRLGWSVLVVWQCQLRNPVVLRDRIVDFLG